MQKVTRSPPLARDETALDGRATVVSKGSGDGVEGDPTLHRRMNRKGATRASISSGMPNMC